MKTLLPLFAVAFLAALPARGDDYTLGPDSQEQPGVPKGAVSEFAWKESKVYPGTERKCWIYLPPALDKDKEYPLIIFQDGGGAVNPKGGFRATIVMDNLIHKGDIPAMVGLFIEPGNVPRVTPEGKGRRLGKREMLGHRRDPVERQRDLLRERSRGGHSTDVEVLALDPRIVSP